jgi:diguanylate cyclase (GGDEF)-like protein/PAS domain S-box-containing protein
MKLTSEFIEVIKTGFSRKEPQDYNKMFVLAVVYFLAAKFGLSLAMSTEQVTTIWPPTGIALAALLLLGYEVWPGIFLGAFVANLLTNEPVLVAFGIAIGNTLSGLLAAFMLKKVGMRLKLDRLLDVLWLALFGSILSTVVSASIGVLNLMAGGLVQPQNFGHVWLTWWVGDLTGILVVAPIVLLLREKTNLGIIIYRKWEGLTLLSLLFIFAYFVFFRFESSVSTHLMRFLFPFLIWAALRFSQIGAIVVSFTIAAIAIWATILGKGPFTSSSVEQNLIYLSTYLFIITITALVLAAVVAERKKVEIGLESTENRFKALIENSADGVVLIDSQANIIYSSNAITKLLGYEVNEFVGRNGFDLMHPEDTARVQQVFLQLLQSAPGAVVNTEYRYLHKDGSWHWIEATGNNLLSKKEVKAIVVNYRDVTERKAIEERVRYQAGHDPLTDLSNRAYFSDTIEELIRNPKRKAFALLVLDMDRFKIINDSLGHAVGDAILQQAAIRIKSCTQGLCARLGGDEFTVLFDNYKGERDAAQLSQQILEEFKAPFYLDNREIFLSVSIGISIYPDDGRDSATLLKNADAALYRAKEQGRNNYQFYIPSLNASVSKQLSLENSLRKAIAEKEFVVYYIPQVDSRTGRIVSLEALVRWRNPESGLIFPDEFIPLAEASGLIEEIDEFVLRTAVKQTSEWNRAGFPNLGISVNLSSRQFKPKLVKFLREILTEYHLPPRNLVLELTERSLIESSVEVMEIMQRIKSMGVKISIDDFNTGYSTLNYIKRFPIDYLKIGIQFIKGVPHNNDDCAIAKSIITLGHSLGKGVVAEGVEGKPQLQFLQNQGVDLMQGYLFSGPVPTESLQEILFQDRQYLSLERS